MKYISAHKKGLLKQQITAAKTRLEACDLCPRMCGVNRMADELGTCKTGQWAWISSIHAHMGEESPLVGINGSGTIFFTHCNLLCNFCQNYEISHQGEGRPVDDNQLAQCMLSLQRDGCHNINFVTPSHVVPQILSALEIAIDQGLKIPLVYNTSAYDRVETLQLMDGIVDIYLPDFKFWDSGIAEKTCQAPDYPQVACQAILEMHRQVGDLKMDSSGIAKSGLMIRHLVLPNNLAGTEAVMTFIAEQISTDTYVNIMPQYRPCGQVHQIEEMASTVSAQEFQAALEIAGKVQHDGIATLVKTYL